MSSWLQPGAGAACWPASRRRNSGCCTGRVCVYGDHETLPLIRSTLTSIDVLMEPKRRITASSPRFLVFVDFFSCAPPHGCAGCIVFAPASLLEDIVWAVTEPPLPANVLHAAPTSAGGDGAPPVGRRGAARHSAPHGSETQLECYGTLPHVTQADLEDALLKVTYGVTVRLTS